MRLRGWVKVTLIIAVLTSVIAFGYNYTNKSINACVEAGNSQNMCEMELR